MHTSEHVDVVVVGAGQAGLATGYHLARHPLRFVILDGAARIGDSWRQRWDSLRLFTPARFDGLPGLPFPAPGHAFPTKDEVGDYLERYAAHFALPVRLGTRVTRVSQGVSGFLVETSRGTIVARNVIVAMSSYQAPRMPALARALSADIVQFHSTAYRNPAQLPDGPVLVVGSGNSGVEIALDVARGGSRRVILAGRDTGHVPFDIEGRAARLFLTWFVARVVFHRILQVTTPLGRRARAGVHGKGGPLVRSKPADLVRAGIRRVERVESVVGGLPVVANGERLDVKSVIWSTGFAPSFSWIDLPIFDAQGEPMHESGEVRAVPGVYFVGLTFLHAMSSSMLHGVGRDARRVVEWIAARRRAA